ncbi:MAG TPA: hypothetical protein VHO06_22115 [Polyangia bacterium]|nr:hypothetical protein [Polyangia bacterium]
MSRLSKDSPDRLLVGEASDFERQVLDSALEKRPSAAASARMAKALGVTVTTVGTAAAAKALAGQSVSKAAAVGAAGTSWSWVSVGVLGLVVAGTVAGVRARHAPASALAPDPPALGASAISEPPLGPPAQPAAGGSAPVPVPTRPVRRSRPAASGTDLRDEIAVVDAARSAISGGDAARALEILRRYDAKYASGSFRPEATAIKVEALVKLGRQNEARALAARFVAEQRGTLLARRVAELVGFTDSAVGP